LTLLENPNPANSAGDLLQIHQDKNHALMQGNWPAWQAWLSAWIRDSLTPTLDLLGRGVLQEIEIIFAHPTQLHTLQLTRWQAKQFWRRAWAKPAALFSESLIAH
jgi:hypothetical protein